MNCHWDSTGVSGRRGQANPGARRPASGLKPNDPSRKGEAPMPKLRLLAALTAATTVLCAATALADPVTLNVRVEGPNSTSYEGPITTGIHKVDGGDGTARDR